jgi:hypothetical protein
MKFSAPQDPHYREATLRTAAHLREVAGSAALIQLSHLTLPEIEQVVDLVARIIPAGNVPGILLSGLARLPGRKPPPEVLRRDIDLLFRSLSDVVDQAVFGTIFAVPGAVIWGYQNLLKLAGKDPADSFPEGTWQFYADYALRDDTARHTNETRGFDTHLEQHSIYLSRVDRIAAWSLAAINCLHQYPALLENEWRERTYTHLLAQAAAGTPHLAACAALYRQWETQRPYGRGVDAAGLNYPEYRRAKFDQFLRDATGSLTGSLKKIWQHRVQAAEMTELPAYQRQIGLHAYLEPGPYGETRTPLPLSALHLGLVWRGHYYLIPAHSSVGPPAPDPQRVRAQIAALLDAPPAAPGVSLIPLVRLKRSALVELQGQWSQAVKTSRQALRQAPILINCDPLPALQAAARPRPLPLSELRQAERGLGDHALTIFDTGSSFLFDQSHIFFDGAWGATLAEILTNEAISWALYLAQLPPTAPALPPQPLTFAFTAVEMGAARRASRVSAEVGAENDAARLRAILLLRKLFKQRSDLLQLTVNDLLILFRAIHAVTYQPNPALVEGLQSMTRNERARAAAQAALQAVDPTQVENPAMIIPMDASPASPRDRLYPLNFEVPLGELDLIGLHVRTVQALEAYYAAHQGNRSGEQTPAYIEFDSLQRRYLATLASFGQMVSKARQIALLGESAGVGAIKMLANLPPPLQRMLEAVPDRFDLLNDMLKGREVISNVGAVAPSSSLTRFITAKDDNEKKTLAWGVLTDARGVMHISLRDFRPHVRLLDEAGYRRVAQHMVQEYLDTYVVGLNHFVDDLLRITRTSRETQLSAPDGKS